MPSSGPSLLDGDPNVLKHTFDACLALGPGSSSLSSSNFSQRLYCSAKEWPFAGAPARSLGLGRGSRGCDACAAGALSGSAARTSGPATPLSSAPVPDGWPSAEPLLSVGPAVSALSAALSSGV